MPDSTDACFSCRRQDESTTDVRWSWDENRKRPRRPHRCSQSLERCDRRMKLAADQSRGYGQSVYASEGCCGSGGGRDKGSAQRKSGCTDDDVNCRRNLIHSSPRIGNTSVRVTCRAFWKLRLEPLHFNIRDTSAQSPASSSPLSTSTSRKPHVRALKV